MCLYIHNAYSKLLVIFVRIGGNDLDVTDVVVLSDVVVHVCIRGRSSVERVDISYA